MLSATPSCGPLSRSDFNDLLTREREAASKNAFTPRNTVRCNEAAIFRTKAARHAACLLDADPFVLSWSCLPRLISWKDGQHVPDFLVKKSSGIAYIDVTPVTGNAPPSWMPEAAKAQGWRYEVMSEASFADGCRLANAQEMLRYAAFDVSLGDRVRVLSFLEEHGPAPLATCMTVIRNGQDPVGVLAALALRRFIDIEIDEALLGPDTRVSCFRS